MVKGYYSKNLVKLLLSTILVLVSSALVFLPDQGERSGKLGNLPLGLDLLGGAQVLLRVDHKSYLFDRLNSARERILQHAHGRGIPYRGSRVESEYICIELAAEGDASHFLAFVRDLHPELQPKLAGTSLYFSYSSAALASLRSKLVTSCSEIVRRRIDNAGTKDAFVQPQGDGCISVQVPGLMQQDSLRELIGKTAKLEFYLVRQEVGSLCKTVKDSSGNELVVHALPLLTGASLKDASVGFSNETGAPVVQFVLDSDGAKRFSEITKLYTGSRIAVVLDDEVVSAPLIQSHIAGGEGIICGSFSLDEVVVLANLLKSGAMPTGLEFVRETTVGPTLGSESLAKGRVAGVASLFTVASFMAICYGWLGVIASLSLVAVLLITLGLIIVFGVVLTLPGVAGIILTLGMAVDSSILAYEHMREKLIQGKAHGTAISQGFAESFVVILDSNLTSLIAAALLYYFGIGSIRGFAVIFSIGIFSSVFACFFVTYPLVNLYYSRFKPAVTNKISFL